MIMQEDHERCGNRTIGSIMRKPPCYIFMGRCTCASSMFKHFLQGFFAEDINFAHGVACHGPRGSFLLRASLQTVLADGVAKCSLWRCKGSSGLKCYMFCANVVGARSGLDGGRLVTVECSDVSKFICHTDATIWKTVDELAVLEYLGAPPFATAFGGGEAPPLELCLEDPLCSSKL